MTQDQGITTLTDAQLEAMLHRAALQGAQEALKNIGLDDERAGADVRELRDVLTAWRDTKRAVWQQVIRAITTLFLLALGGGLAALIYTGQPHK